MSEDVRPQDMLDNALTYQPGQGVILKFANRGERDRFRQRLYSAKASAVRISKTQDALASPDWGMHHWGNIIVSLESETELWIGRQAEIKVGTELVPSGRG